MPQLLALEWDQFEARVVVAQQRGGEVRIEHAFSVSLAPRDPGQTFADADVGPRLAAALAARHIGRVETLVAVGRSNIELRRLTLPPAPEDEWPDLVRFQALPQFTNMGEDWPLDFFPLQSGNGEGASVLAATIAPQMVDQISATCQSAGLTPSRLVLRPCAAASLLIQRGDAGAHRVRLLVDLLADEADLTVLVDRGVALTRTVRLPAAGNEDDARQHDRLQALSGEIRRTIASVQNQLGGERVEQIVLCGDDEGLRDLSKELAQRFDLPVEHFDPFAGFRLSSELGAKPPQHPERFAPLLGMIVDEAAGRRHAVDFLNPRKKAPPPNRRRLYAIGAALAATVVIAIIAWGWMALDDLQRTNAKLKKELDGLKGEVEKSKGIREQTAIIDAWDGGHTQWLNELELLSTEPIDKYADLAGDDLRQRCQAAGLPSDGDDDALRQRLAALDTGFPAAKDARLIELKAAQRARGGSQLTLTGYSRESEVMQEMEAMLRDERHTVVSGPGREAGEDTRYPWWFQETVKIYPVAGDGEQDTGAIGAKGGRR